MSAAVEITRENKESRSRQKVPDIWFDIIALRSSNNNPSLKVALVVKVKKN